MVAGKVNGLALLFGVLALVLAQTVRASAPVQIRYRCDNSEALVVRQSDDEAAVRYMDRSYLLRRTHSNIGKKYLAPRAALIIDGQSAVFVAEDRLHLGQCLETGRTARSR